MVTSYQVTREGRQSDRSRDLSVACAIESSRIRRRPAHPIPGTWCRAVFTSATSICELAGIIAVDAATSFPQGRQWWVVH